VVGDINDEWESRLTSADDSAEAYIRHSQKNVLDAMSRLESILDDGMKHFKIGDGANASLDNWPPPDIHCDFQIPKGHAQDYQTNPDYLRIRFASSYISNQLRYVNLVLNDSDDYDWKENVASVSRIMSSMLLNLGCLEPIFQDKWEQNARYIHAEIRRTEARRVVRAVERLKNSLTPDDVSSQYRKAQRMLSVAKDLIEADYRAAQEKRDTDLQSIFTTDPLDAAQPSALGRTYRQITQLQTYVTQQINNL
jgi:hypothetical protein